MGKDAGSERQPACPRCSGREFIDAQIRRDPRTFELVQQVLCVRRDCQVVLGVMTLSSLAKRPQ
jgi:hypothetical protein